MKAEDLEGTLLAEGSGTGRATRFPAPGLYDQRLDIGSSGPGITGGRGGIDKSTVLDFQAPQIQSRNLNPLETKPAITVGRGPSPEAIHNVGQMLSKAAFDYAERQDEAAATEAVLAYNDYARDKFFGNPEKDVPGFHDLKGKAAVDARKEYFSSVDSKMADIVGSLEPRVKQKALSRLATVRDTALNRGASHIATEQKQYEENLQVRLVEDIGRELSVDYSNPEGLKDSLMKVYQADEKEGSKAWDAVAVNAVHQMYMNEYKRTGSGIEAANHFRAAVGDTLSLKAKDVIDEYILSQEHHERTAAKAEEADRRAASREAADLALSNAMVKFDQNPGTIRSMSDVYAMAPELMGHQTHANTLWRYANSIRKERDGEISKERLTDFYMDKVIPMQENGEMFVDKGDMLSAAMDYGITDPKKISSMWTEMRGRMTEDKRSLNQYYHGIVKSLDTAFKGAPELPPLPANATKEQKAEYSRNLFLSAAAGRGTKPDPPELQVIKGALLQMYQDKTLTPYEAATKIESYMAERMTAAGAPKELANVNNIEVLANQYRYQTYKGNLIKREQQKAVPATPPERPFAEKLGELFSAFKKGASEAINTIPSNEAQALQNGYGIQPTIENRQKIFTNAEKSGYKNLRFSDGENIGGSPWTGYVGSKKQKDGTYKEVRLGIK